MKDRSMSLYSESYFDCRETFIETARACSAEVKHHFYPSSQGRDYSTTVASLGSAQAPRHFVVTAGVHGVELPPGSRIQCEWLDLARDYLEENPDTICFHFVHALNPFGSAHDLRTNEDNVDPNRNFREDHKKTSRRMDAYEKLARAFSPRSLSALSRLGSWAAIGRFACARGLKAVQDALVFDQNSHPDGLYYAGREPSWTYIVWSKIAREIIETCEGRGLVHLDLHAGYGPRGSMQLFPGNNLTPFGSSNLFNRVQKAGIPVGSFSPEKGDIIDFWPLLGVGKNAYASLTVEVGTSRFNDIDTLDSLIRRNALFVHYGDRHPQAASILQAFRRTFAPDDPVWIDAVSRQSRRLFVALTAPGNG